MHMTTMRNQRVRYLLPKMSTRSNRVARFETELRPKLYFLLFKKHKTFPLARMVRVCLDPGVHISHFTLLNEDEWSRVISSE